MVSLAQLWIPILLSAVLVFVASSLVHMVIKWHNPDYRKLDNEDEVRGALNKSRPAPGLYLVPHCADMKQMQSPEMQQKFKDGPIGFLTLRAPGLPKMGKALAQWFALTLAFSYVAAYVAGNTLGAGAGAIQVSRIVGTVAFLAYAGGMLQDGIWMGRPWGSVAKYVLDGAIYAALTAVTFAWLWPK